MRAIIFSLGLIFFALPQLSAGHLDLAVIQFPEPKTPEELEAALNRVQLAEITDADRTRTRESYLKGGYVIFAQTLPVSSNSSFMLSTRLKNNRADVEGHLNSGNLNATITVMEGVKAGIRNFEKRIYSGAGELPPGVPHIISIRILKGKAPKVVRGQSSMTNYQWTTVLAAQYHP